MDFVPDSHLGVYRIVRLLGQGGMGAVYEAEHGELKTRVALKVFSFEGDDSESLRRRFLTEARLLARLRHPHLVRVLDLGTDDKTGLTYFAMDLVLAAEGKPQTLADAVAAVDHVLTKMMVSEQTKGVYRAYVLEECPAEEVAVRFGISKENVYSVENRVDKMVAMLEDEYGDQK